MGQTGNFRNLGISENSSATLPAYSIPLKFGPQSDYGNNRWEVYSPKLKRNVTLYSNLEYDHWALVEFDSEIETFCEQPLKIRIKLPIGVVTTIFDMWIRWKSGLEEFREVKFESDLLDNNPKSRVAKQIQGQRKWCELKNKKYSVFTEKIIRSNPIYLSNLKLILRYLGKENAVTKSLSEKIISILLKQGATSINEIEKRFVEVESSVIRSTIFGLVYSGNLKIPLTNQIIDLNSVMEVADV